MHAAQQETRPADLQEVDAEGLQRLLDDRRSEDGKEEEPAGLELAYEGPEDAEDAADERDEDGEEQAERANMTGVAPSRTT